MESPVIKQIRGNYFSDICSKTVSEPSRILHLIALFKPCTSLPTIEAFTSIKHDT